MEHWNVLSVSHSPGQAKSGKPFMNLNRRQLLSSIAAVAASKTLREFAGFRPVLALASPAALAADPRRPQYHLLPAANWMNDPNGPIYWLGQYHMFYQYNPNGAYWGDMHWGHAVSPDMVHWRHLPVALEPTPGGPDAGGCFSGTALADGGRVAMLYTGVVPAPEDHATIRDGVHSLRESQCLAFGAGADLTTWSTDATPVIADPPPGLDVTGFRDPAPWKHGDEWLMAVGSGIRGKGGAVLLYRSRDLRHWEYLHLLAGGSGNGDKTPNPVDSGDMWECPDFFPLGDKHVLIHSTQGKAYWQSGSFDTDALVFHPERGGILDFGSFYAPKTQLDHAQIRILWGWIPETRPEAEYRAAGWAGLMSLPRVLTVDAGGDLRIAVPAQVEKLRRSERKLNLTGDEETDRRQLSALQLEDCCGEIACSFRRGADPIEFSLVSGQDTGNALLICRYDPSHPREVLIDEKAVPVGAAGPIELRFFIDGSVIEIFANSTGAVTKRFYFSGSTAPPIRVKITEGWKSFSALSLWQVSPISRDRLTT
jgi:beta-fructofuranosidase